MTAVPWKALGYYIEQEEIDRLENIVTLLCILAIGRWMYVERYGDEPTKMKYWRRGFWTIAVTLLLSTVSRAVFLGGSAS